MSPSRRNFVASMLASAFVAGSTPELRGDKFAHRDDEPDPSGSFALEEGWLFSFDHAASMGGLYVRVHIRNTGTVDSDEVPQVYLGAPSEIPDGVQFPVRALAAFDRVHFSAGESKTLTLHVAPRQLQYWSAWEGKWVTARGKRTVSVGASSRDLRAEQSIVE